MKRLLQSRGRVLGPLFVFVLSFGVGFPQSRSQTLGTSTKSSGFLTLQMESRLRQRRVPLGVLLPSSYSSRTSKGRRYPIVYLLHGHGGHFTDWGKSLDLLKYLESPDLIFVAVEGGNSWYSDSVNISQDKYESYLIQELIPEIDRRFHTIAKRNGRAIAGYSMGGYGAMKFGLKYPDLFAIVGSFSGSMDAPLRRKDHPRSRPSIITVFGDDNSKTRVENDLFGLARRVPVQDLPFFYFSCGTEDGLLGVNRDLAHLFVETKIPHEFRQLPGSHNWEFWNLQLKEFLPKVNRHFKTSATTRPTATTLVGTRSLEFRLTSAIGRVSVTNTLNSSEEGADLIRRD